VLHRAHLNRVVRPYGEKMPGTYRYWLVRLSDWKAETFVLFTENGHDGGMLRNYTHSNVPPQCRRVLLPEV
jgi:hypothetical protein